ncbi:hypothetical protein [Pedobacter foliorum]|uniref:hypothetical protein n=1 Tax=Pedobacter foliorum TaxID=2739058 RepID=UPI0015654109|nr:hypothetical protein [Pedobacter foliorum]NRF38586.1 hypothetical protein [Pedobacter foliorum]
MLKSISFINIVLAIVYFLFYLLNSTSYAMIGILIVIAFSALTIRNVEKGLKPTAIYFILGVLMSVFAGFLVVWTYNVILSSFEHDYFGNSWLYIAISICLIAGIIIQIGGLFIRRP